MGSRDALGRLLATKLDDRLRAHIASIDLSLISRVAFERIESTANHHVGLIEFVSGSTFAETYDAVYITEFHGGERERSDLIVERLRADFAGERQGLAPYRVLGIKDHSGRAIAAAQFSVLALVGEPFAVPYLQYIYVRQENRRQGLSELLHTLVLAVATADAAKFETGASRSVPFAFFETEPPVHGPDDNKRAVAAQRTKIHSKSGSLALMLRENQGGRILSAHVQPGLEVGEPPLTLVWALRARPGVELEVTDELARALVAAYYQSLRDEGFPEMNIVLAEAIVEARYSRGTSFRLMPLSEITKEMYVGIDG